MCIYKSPTELYECFIPHLNGHYRSRQIKLPEPRAILTSALRSPDGPPISLTVLRPLYSGSTHHVSRSGHSRTPAPAPVLVQPPFHTSRVASPGCRSAVSRPSVQSLTRREPLCSRAGLSVCLPSRPARSDVECRPSRCRDTYNVTRRCGEAAICIRCRGVAGP